VGQNSSSEILYQHRNRDAILSCVTNPLSALRFSILMN